MENKTKKGRPPKAKIEERVIDPVVAIPVKKKVVFLKNGIPWGWAYFVGDEVDENVIGSGVNELIEKQIIRYR